MKQFMIMLLLHQALPTFADIKFCTDTTYTSLIQDLSCYDQNKAATNGSEPVKINIALGINSFKLNNEKQEFTAFTWTHIKWNDDRLKWNPEKYNHLAKVELPTGKLWIPSIKLINTIEDKFEDKNWFTRYCDVSSFGAVRCVLWTVYRVQCKINAKDWPYDTQHCTLEFGLSPQPGSKAMLDVKASSVRMVAEAYSEGWNLFNLTKNVNSDKLMLKFTLRRHAHNVATMLLYPSFVISTLNLTSLLIDARRKTRLLVLCFSLMCQFNFLSKLAEDIPKQSENAPKLLLFYRGTFIMTSVLIGVSFVLSKVCRNDKPCPVYIRSVNDFVYGNIVKYTVWPRWETKEGNEDTKCLKNWTDFANIVNVIWILVAILVYIIMYFVFIPLPFNSIT